MTNQHGLPPMEPLQPNPHYVYVPEPDPPPVTKKRKRRTARRRRAATANKGQSRDRKGRFAEKWGAWWDGWLEPQPPTKLKKRPAPAARQHSKTKNRKKPVPERGIAGQIGAIFNGDYGKWKQQQNRKNARLAMLAQGYDIPRPRRRRRRRKALPAPRRRVFGLF